MSILDFCLIHHQALFSSTQKKKKSVLLIEKRDDNFYGIVGCLESLDIDGPHWSTGTDLFSQIFGPIFTNKPSKNTEQLNPTYWCEIELPEEDENVQYKQ